MTRSGIASAIRDRVTEIVDACSDTGVQPKPPWRERKAKYHAHLLQSNSSVRLVSAADKLHNVSAILSDYRQIGDKLWDRFSADKEDQLWNYQELVKAFKAGESTALIEELERAVKELEAVVD